MEKKVNEVYPARLEEYAEKYKEWLKFRREDGILEVRFHMNDGPLKWSGGPQHAILHACHDINHDPENEVVIITGTGDGFIEDMLPPKESQKEGKNVGNTGSYRNPYQVYDWWYHIQTEEPISVLGLQMPVIAAVNGPTTQHPELSLTADVCICSENATFSEQHFSRFGVPCGDGTWPLWRTLIGHNRARYLMWMGGVLTAAQAYEWGAVQEVVPLEKLNERAWEIARMIMKQPRYTRRMQHQITAKYWREVYTREIDFGLAHEGFAAVSDNPDVWSDTEVQH